MLQLQPITLDEAKSFILKYHRHHLPSIRWKFGVAVSNGDRVVGVCMVGRPVARMLDDGWTLEVTRCCTDGTKNAASMLYGAAARAAFAMGYKKLITYTLASEPGTSLKCANFKLVASVKGRSWNCTSRPRVDKFPPVDKKRWELLP